MTEQKKQEQRVWILLLCAFTTFTFMCMIVVYTLQHQTPDKITKRISIEEQYESCNTENQQLRAQLSQNQHMTIPPLLMK